jgi:hypothetical protein
VAGGCVSPLDGNQPIGKRIERGQHRRTIRGFTFAPAEGKQLVVALDFPCHRERPQVRRAWLPGMELGPASQDDQSAVHGRIGGSELLPGHQSANIRPKAASSDCSSIAGASVSRGPVSVAIRFISLPAAC